MHRIIHTVLHICIYAVIVVGFLMLALSLIALSVGEFTYALTYFLHAVWAGLLFAVSMWLSSVHESSKGDDYYE